MDIKKRKNTFARLVLVVLSTSISSCQGGSMLLPTASVVETSSSRGNSHYASNGSNVVSSENFISHTNLATLQGSTTSSENYEGSQEKIQMSDINFANFDFSN